MIFKKTLFKMCVLGLSAGLLLGSCKDYDDDIDQLRDDVARINETLSGLQNIVSGLEKSIKDGMLISSVADQTDGILVTFSDGSTKKILHGTDGTNGTNGENGKDGNTPVIYIDQDGYWCVTVGEQSQQITDSNGDPVCAYGQDGVKGDPGEKGDQGDKGADGRHGYSISAQYVDGYLTFTVYDPNDDNAIVEVISTNIRPSGSVVDLVVERSYYYEFIIDGKAYRIARVTPLPSSVKVMTPVVLSIKGKQAYALVSISPSNYTDLNLLKNLQLDFAGVTRSSDFAFNTPDFARVDAVEKLSDQNDRWNDRYSSNGGEYVVTFSITGDVVDSQYDVIVQYPSVPEEFNAIVAVDDLEEYLKDEYELATSWAYTRSVNSLSFVSDVVELQDPSAVTLDQTEASINSYQSHTGSILVDAEKFPYDLSYLWVEDYEVTAAYRGVQVPRYEQYLMVENLKRVEAEADGTLAKFTATPNKDAIEGDNSIAVGGEIVYTVTFTVSDYAGTSTTVSLELTVTKVRTRTSLATTIGTIYIPVTETHVLDADDNQLRQALMGRLGYSENEYTELTMEDAVIRIMKDGEETENNWIDVVNFTAGSSKSLSITADKTIPTGEYTVSITIDAPDREFELYYYFTVYAPMYTVDIDLSYVDTHPVVEKYADRIDYQIDLKDVVEANTLTVQPISEMGSVPAPAYILNMDGSIGEKGLKVSQETVTGEGKWNDRDPQTVELYVELESGQRIPVQAVIKGDPTDPYGESGEMKIKIIADRFLSFKLSGMEWPAMNVYDDEIVYEQLFTTPLEINIIAEGEFDPESPNPTVTGYANLLDDPRIDEIKFEMMGIDDSGTAVQAEDLLEFDSTTNPGQVFIKAKPGVTPWTETAIQKARVTVTDIFGSKPVVQEFTFKVVYN